MMASLGLIFDYALVAFGAFSVYLVVWALTSSLDLLSPLWGIATALALSLAWAAATRTRSMKRALRILVPSLLAVALILLFTFVMTPLWRHFGQEPNNAADAWQTTTY